MDKRKIKRPGAIKREATDLFELVRDTYEPGMEIDIDEYSWLLLKDLERMPQVGFSYKELFVVLRFLAQLNAEGAEVICHEKSEAEGIMCDVLVDGISDQLNEYTAKKLGRMMKAHGIEVKEDGTDDV